MRGVRPTVPAVTPGMSRRVRSWENEPTVTATPTMIWLTITALAEALPVDSIGTAGGEVAGCAVMPARYCWSGVASGTWIVNRRVSLAPGLRVTVDGRPVTQQPSRPHFWK